jgi:hypothetical protein
VELARDPFGVTLSTGAVDAICQRASDALAGPYLQLHDSSERGSGNVDHRAATKDPEGRKRICLLVRAFGTGGLGSWSGIRAPERPAARSRLSKARVF